MKFVNSLSVIVFLLSACSSAQFSGSGGSSNSGSPAPTPPAASPSTPPPASPPATQTPPAAPAPTPTPAAPNGPGTPGTPGNPGYSPIPGTYIPNTNGQCPGGPCAPGQVPQWGPSTEIDTTIPNQVTFGKDHVFHIGNGQFSGSSCKFRLWMLPLTGTIYFFQFEVPNDNTMISVNISRACGVDYSTGVVQLAAGGTPLLTKPVLPGASGVGVHNGVLNRGIYTIYVYAGKSDGVEGPAGDIDDFIIGNVQISANQPIRAGVFGTYQ